MATLNVTNLQNTAATVTNVSLLADGTTTLVLNSTGTSRLGGLRYNAGNLEVYTAGAVWAPIGGGGGSVSAVTASLPRVSTGGATPNLTIGIGLGTAINGSNIAVSIPVAATPPAVGTSAVQATNGSLYWDNNLGALFLRYFDGTTAQWVQAAASGNVTAATAAQAAAGTLTTTYLSPATGVPKDAAGMTGAALLPSGTNAQRAAIASPVAGMTRFNTTNTSLEFYDGFKWVPLAPNVPACSVYANAPQAVVTATYTKVALDTEIFDNYNFFNTATNRFQPLISGYYQISAVVRGTTSVFPPDLSNSNAVAYKNGTPYQRFSELATNAVQIGVIQLTGSCVVYMNGTTDYLELYGQLNGTSLAFGSVPAAGAFSSFSAVLVAS